MSRFVFVFAAALILAAPALPQGRGNGRGQGHGRGHQEEQAAKGSPFDRDVIASYYRGTPGHARRGDLPPGLEKQLRRNGTLPPGLAKKIAPLPPALEMRLAPCPPETRRGIVGGVAILYNSRTGLIIDSSVVFAR